MPMNTFTGPTSWRWRTSASVSVSGSAVPCAHRTVSPRRTIRVRSSAFAASSVVTAQDTCKQSWSSSRGARLDWPPEEASGSFRGEPLQLATAQEGRQPHQRHSAKYHSSQAPSPQHQQHYDDNPMKIIVGYACVQHSAAQKSGLGHQGGKDANWEIPQESFKYGPQAPLAQQRYRQIADAKGEQRCSDDHRQHHLTA